MESKHAHNFMETQRLFGSLNQGINQHEGLKQYLLRFLSTDSLNNTAYTHTLVQMHISISVNLFCVHHFKKIWKKKNVEQ